MNLQTQITPALWQAISKSYEASGFKNAILDAIHYLTDIIRNKADVEGDGSKMLGPAFGGTNPRISINKLQTLSERDAQAGMHKILEGIYQGIRNPRSHEQVEDNRETADAIILFVNYILCIIDTSRGPFVLDDWIKRVIDPDFVPSAHYAEIVVTEVPPKRYIDSFITLYRRKMEADSVSLNYVFEALIEKIGEGNLDEIIDVISDELRSERSERIIKQAISAFPSRLWPKIAEDVRLRIEHKLLKAIQQGTVEDKQFIDELNDTPFTSTMTNGFFGSWINCILDQMIHKQELYDNLMRKISGAYIERAYVIECFLDALPKIVENAPVVEEKIPDLVALQLCAGASHYPSYIRDKIRTSVDRLPNEWSESMAKRIIQTAALNDDEDIPF